MHVCIIRFFVCFNLSEALRPAFAQFGVERFYWQVAEARKRLGCKGRFGDSEGPTYRDLGVSENRGYLSWGPYNKDPTI